MKGEFEYGQLKEALVAIAEALDVPRTRAGKLDYSSNDLLMKANKVKALAVRYKVGGCEDVAMQCQKVAAAVLDDAAFREAQS